MTAAIHRLSRELIAAVLRPGADRRPIVRVALELEEALNASLGPSPADVDDSTARYQLVEIE